MSNELNKISKEEQFQISSQQNQILNIPQNQPEEQQKLSQENTIPNPNEQFPDQIEYFNITGDGGIKKRIIKEGSGDLATEGKEVVILYSGKHLNKIFCQSTNNEPITFVLGEKKVCKGWEIAIKTMKKNEKSEYIICPIYYKDNKEITDITQANDDLVFEIELLEISEHKKTIDDLSNEELIKNGKVLKNEGVEKFKNGDFMSARDFFKKAIIFLERINFNDPTYNEEINLYLTTLSNLCNCLNKEQDYTSIINYANRGLKISTTRKLLYFRAIAYANLDEFDCAINDLNGLEYLLSEEEKQNDYGIQNLRNIIEKRQIIFNEKNKKFSRAVYRENLLNGRLVTVIPQIVPFEINENNPIVFLDIKIENNIKRIEVELFKDKTPKTAENFRCLCTGEKNENLFYKGTIINKVIKNFVIKGGKIGDGCNSIYDGFFEDENYYYAHCREGLLSMANNGKNKNGTEFMITLKYLPWLDGKHTVFGKVIKGLEVIKEIANIETDNEDKPIIDVVIENSGEIKYNSYDNINQINKNQ